MRVVVEPVEVCVDVIVVDVIVVVVVCEVAVVVNEPNK